ncbi:CDGSH iron-sulfur domain-containing protein [Cognatishimia sp. SS12]|uniref:CDGSH iron-sulfur domain-containing protein n=1 Tax=Cognatishimia sp. SS12 TaxID=2979465 RepID=UPI002330804E|nr:CDGSH iron-sulfur domain-containing protein [Cognatishimia sp. SS12]MDC0737698.1 CDGSH iron-sulfur domain-containing protein [Cognatishimia sp. SS12]
MSDNPSITARENGPLVVKGVSRMQGRDGEEVECKPVMALCRCGHSGNKPFCDGSHSKVGFDSSAGTPAGRDRLLNYVGKDITVTFNPLLCSHAAQCGKLAKHIFNAAEKPWVQPDNGTVEEVREVIAACPSGALALTEEEGPHLFPDRAEITVEKNGPYWVLDVTAPAPTQAERQSERKFVLCRCGKSGNKPYCDGTHRDAKWRDD